MVADADTHFYLVSQISEKTIEEKGVMDLLIQSCILKYFVIITFIWYVTLIHSYYTMQYSINNIIYK